MKAGKKVQKKGPPINQELTTLSDLRQHYDTINPVDVKLNILWIHIQALMTVHLNTDIQGTDNYKMIAKYKKDWKDVDQINQSKWNQEQKQ